MTGRFGKFHEISPTDIQLWPPLLQLRDPGIGHLCLFEEDGFQALELAERFQSVVRHLSSHQAQIPNLVQPA